MTGAIRLHILDDENAFVETAEEVRRLAGHGLLAWTGRELSALDGLRVPAEPAPVTGTRSVAVVGSAALTTSLRAVFDQTARVQAYDPGETCGETELLAGKPELVVVATASLFDPNPVRISEICVRNGIACLCYGVVRKDVTFVGPLWTPDRLGACYACLRTRINSNSVHAGTWQAYSRFLAEAGKRPFQHPVAPWVAARLAGEAGRRADAWLTAPDADPVTQLSWWEDGQGTDRCLLAVPGCAVCGGRDVEATQVASITDAEDDRVGIVHSSTVRRAETGPPVYLSGSTSADLSLVKPALRITKNGGAGFAKKDAINATIGESLERYAAGFYRPERLTLSSWRDLSGPAVEPARFGLFSAEQHASPGFPFAPFTEDTVVRWTRADPCTGGEPVWVPASQVYLHYRRVRAEAAIGPSISTGLAAGQTVAQATLNGLYEVIERDALAISWLHRLPPRPVPPSLIARSAQVTHLLERAPGCRVRFFDLSLDLAPTVIVAVLDHRSGVGETTMAFGSACRWSPVDALDKAFLEAAQGLTYVRRLLKQHEDWEPDAGFANVDTFNKHAILYTKHPELRERAGYLVHPSRVPECTRPARRPPGALDTDATVAAIAEELAAAGHPAYAVEVTTPDVRQLGVHVVRVLVPGLQHLAGVHSCRFLGTARLREVVERLGIYSAPDNPYPHPLP